MIITLVKRTSVHGTLAVGETYEWSYASSDQVTAKARAFRALKRDHPDENPLDWRVADPVEEAVSAGA